MDSYLWKYYIKRLLFVWGIIILIIAIGSLAITIRLSGSKEEIERNLTKWISRQVTIENIAYCPPNFILLRNTTVFQDTRLTGNRMVTVGEIRLKFSLGSFLKKEGIVITDIYFNKSQADYAELTSFLKKNIKQIVWLINHFSKKRDFNLIIKEISLLFTQESSLTIYATIDSSFKIAGEKITSFGSVALTKLSPEVEPLHYNFKGILTKDGVFIEELDFKAANYCVRLWGGLENNFLKLGGFLLVEKLNLYIFDINCIARLALPKIQIESLSLGLRRSPFFLKGDIDFSSSTSSNLAFFSEELEIGIKNLVFYLAEEGSLGVSFEQLALSYLMGEGSFKLPFKDVKLLLSLKDEASQFIKLNAKFCDGLLAGQGYLNLHHLPFRYSFNCEIKEVNVDELVSLPPSLPKLAGTLETRIRYRSHCQPNLSGNITIDNGYLNNVEFLRWFADFFNIPSLQKLNFNKLTISFLVDNNFVHLNKIDLDSKDVTLSGYFKLENTDWGSGKLSLTLSKELLEASPNFQSLLRHLKLDPASLSFDFQFSGPLQAMNIKWLESDFKKELCRIIPDSIERDLDKKIEDALTSFPENTGLTDP